MEAPQASAETCPACGAPVPAGTPSGQCPKCLFKLGLDGPLGPGSTPLTQPESDRLFGNYRLKHQIGRGGMGVVYEAEDVHLHRTVALKVILDAEMASSITRRRFKIEAEAAAKLDHPHIVPIYEVGEHGGQPFISMKLVPGESLRRRMARGELCLGRQAGNKVATQDRQTAIAQLIATLARAVHHAHLRGVLHRDLKPGNILINGDGHPFVTDFGLAKITEAALGDGTPPALTVSGAVIGTPDYMSPEQARGGQVSAATDIYSLGAILYELLTGHPPFHAPSPVETLRSVVEQAPRQPRTVNRSIACDVETICLKCLEKHPSARYGTAAALADDLDRWLRREPIRARPAGPLLRTVRWIRRNPIGTALILSLCLGLGVVTGLLLDAQKKKDRDVMTQRLLLLGLWRGIETDLNSTNTTPIRISSEILCVVGGYPLPLDLGVPSRFTITVSPAEDPVQQAKGYVPFLKRLEKEVAEGLERPVRIDLFFCREYAATYELISQGNTDFQRMGLMPYLLAKRQNPGVEPIVQEDAGKRAVIFARRDIYDRGVTNLARLVGHAFAFGDTDSTITLMAKMLLAHAGIRGTNLSEYRHFTAYDAQTQAAIEGAQDRTGQRDVRPDMDVNREIVRAVLYRGYEAGVVRARFFQRNAHSGLMQLDVFETPPDVYVARAGLDPGVIDTFRTSLLSLKSTPRFVPLNPADCESFRQALTNEAAFFP